MPYKITVFLLLLISTNVFAGTPPPTNASINSWIILAILGLGLPIAAFLLDKKNKK